MGSGFLTTSDNVRIAYDWYPAVSPRAYFVLLHMMPAVKESWRDFASRAADRGISSIAIDLRGHGQSNGGPRGFERFSDEEHKKSMRDVAAAAVFLKTQDAKEAMIFLIGASIGANLALWFLSEHPEVSGGAFLSPGLNYQGITALSFVGKLREGQKVLFIASRDDVRSGGNNAETNRILFDHTPQGVMRKITLYDTGGHGTDILKAHQELTEEILKFIP